MLTGRLRDWLKMSPNQCRTPYPGLRGYWAQADVAGLDASLFDLRPNLRAMRGSRRAGPLKAAASRGYVGAAGYCSSSDIVTTVVVAWQMHKAEIHKLAMRNNDALINAFPI